MYPDVRNIKEAVRECLYQYKSTYVPKEIKKILKLLDKFK